MIKTGTCGFPVSRKVYYRTFSVVEIQETFYQIPDLNRARRLKGEAPEDFGFTLKAWQLITHEPSSPTYRRLKTSIPESKRQHYGSFKPTDEVFEAWHHTEEFARTLGAKVIVFQCPPSFRPTTQNKNNLKEFFKSLKRRDFIFAWEPRGGWSPDVIRSICEDLGLVQVVDPFKDRPVYGEIFYYRLHGIGGLRYQYRDEELKELFEMCPPEGTTYVMFNNVYMFEDARRFLTLCETMG